MIKKRVHIRIFIGLLIYLCIAFAPIYVRAENVVDTRSDIEQNCYTSVYSINNGLPISGANTILQDNDGVIWIGSEEGLTRYDGNSFEYFDATYGVTSVSALVCDNNNVLWIGTKDCGIISYSRGVFKTFSENDGMLSNTVTSIAIDAKGNVVAGTAKGLCYINNKMEVHVLGSGKFKHDKIIGLRNNIDGRIFGFSELGRTFIIDNLELEELYGREEISDSTITCICPSGRNLFFVGTKNGAVIRCEIVGGGLKTRRMKTSSDASIRYLREINGELWVCTDEGIGYYTEKFIFRLMDSFPVKDNINYIFVDIQKNIWISSETQGIMKVSRNRFRNMNLPESIANQKINATCIYNKRLYIGTDSGLVGMNPVTCKLIRNDLADYLQNVPVRFLFPDSSGGMWACVSGKFPLVYHDRNGEIKKFGQDEGINTKVINSVIELKDKRIACAADSGVYIINKNRVEKFINLSNYLGKDQLVNLVEGEENMLFTGTRESGVIIVNLKEGFVRIVNRKSGLKSNEIRCMRKDESTGNVWLVTGNSLAYADKDRNVFTISEFPFASNYDIYFANKKVWVLSSNGIYVVNLENLTKNEKMNYSFFDFRSGLPFCVAPESESFLSDDGNLYISGNKGVARVNIFDDVNEAENVMLKIPYVIADDEILYPDNDNKVVIQKDCERITIVNNVLNYTLSDPYVRYYLDGFLKNVTYETDQSKVESATYTNLPGGEYTYYLDIVDTISGRIKNEITLEIIKEKKIYEDYRIYVLLLAGLVLLTVFVIALASRIKTKKIEHLQIRDEKLLDQVVLAFGKAIDTKEKYNMGHSIRVASYAKQIATEMKLSQYDIKSVYRAALLHDVGKISVSDSILMNVEELDEEQRERKNQHTIEGYGILSEVSLMPELAIGAGYHHEKINGRGYPYGLTGNNIPLYGRIIAVADTFDDLNTIKPNRSSIPMEEIVEIFRRARGTEYDADAVDALFHLIEKMDNSEEKNDEGRI